VTARAARVVELSTQGWSQQAIAAEVGISQPAVSKVLQRADDRALATMHRERVRHLVRVYRCREYVYREASAGWQRSATDRERRVQRRVVRPDGATVTTVTLQSETQAGDPRFLQAMAATLRDSDHTFGLSGLDWPAIAAAQEGENGEAPGNAAAGAGPPRPRGRRGREGR
jgi:hypothetical protein